MCEGLSRWGLRPSLQFQSQRLALFTNLRLRLNLTMKMNSPGELGGVAFDPGRLSQTATLSPAAYAMREISPSLPISKDFSANVTKKGAPCPILDGFSPHSDS